MKISELLYGVDYVGEFEDCEISGVFDDSREVQKNGVFFAFTTSELGIKYANESVQNGAVAIISEEKISIKNNIIVKNLKESFKDFLNKFYDYPLRKMMIIGITGTNGKTSTSKIISNVLNYAGLKTGYIGTLGATWGDNHIDLLNTTPGCKEFYEIIAKMKKDGVMCVVCEVSAHAIAQNRLCNIFFDIGVFTNISQDHLDYFKTMEEYTKVKLDFFDEKSCKYCIVNSDTKEGREIMQKRASSVLSYGIENPADVFGIDFNESNEKQTFVANVMDEVYLIESKLLGEFNRYNLLASLAVCRMLGVSGRRLVECIKKVDRIEGRFNVYKGRKTVIIDYAHTPDGMRNILKEARKMTDGKVVCVFGCGGNRDKLKRPIMGSIAEEESDVVILTSDNSRDEKVGDIFLDIIKGMKEYPIVLPDRGEAIQFALNRNKNDEIVVILGKGAEKYIEKCGKREYFSDAEVVEKTLKSLT